MTSETRDDAPRPLILAVDDEEDILSLYRFILEKQSYRIETAVDGLDAVRKALDISPDLIVLDVMMPRMNGYQVCRLLKSDRRTAEIPIIISTVKSLESDRLYAYTSGADKYLVKPFTSGGLTDVVEDCLRGWQPRGGRRPGHAEREPTTTDTILSSVNRLLDQRLMELTILHHLTRAMVGTLDLDGVLGVIIESIKKLLGYPGGIMFLAREDGVLEERLPRGEPLSINPLEHQLFADTLARDEVTQVATVNFKGRAPSAFYGRLGFPTAILVPLRSKGEAIGLLVVESDTSETIGRDQREFLFTLGSQAALAIENANLYQKTLQLSITDGLTGIFNYRHFRDRLEMEMARARRYLSPLGLFIVDIDHFKIFNDRYGHLMGDEILKEVAALLTQNTRDVDVVARIGGEEFGVILYEMAPDDVTVYAERIRAAVEAARVPGPGREQIGVTISVGVATTPKGEESVDRLVEAADRALYRAKDLGRNRVCVSGASCS